MSWTNSVETLHTHTQKKIQPLYNQTWIVNVIFPEKHTGGLLTFFWHVGIFRCQFS